MTLPPSETRNPNSAQIDTLEPLELVQLINAEDAKVAEAVKAELPAIAQAVSAIEAAFRAGGRLIYAGAGTSGRLGVLDASECGPTFSAQGMVIGLIAGGDHALRHAVEGAEDDRAQGAADLEALAPGAQDVVVGIAVSGATPYVLGILDAATAARSTTIALTCAPGSPVHQAAQIGIAPMVGPEVLTGSSRMKSGTAQKMVLNMLSTAAMIRIGKSYGNLMVDLQVSNAKLERRAVRILGDITGLAPDAAETALRDAGGALKVAILMELRGTSRAQAEAQLSAADGILRTALEGNV